MTTETCPHCGADADDDSLYLCGTEEVLVGVFGRTSGCYEREISQQAAEIERLRQVVLDEREACSDIADQLGTFDYDGHKIAKAIRARGEVK